VPGDTGHWLTLSRGELDRIFVAAGVGAPPSGELEGVLIVWVPGLAHIAAALTRALVWRGKIFERDGVVNLVTPLRLRAVPGEVLVAASRLDGRPAAIIDYSKTSFIAKHVRDEIREVQPGMYLGKVWWRAWRVCDFVLTRPSRRIP
jgi:hypothetical protein